MAENRDDRHPAPQRQDPSQLQEQVRRRVEEGFALRGGKTVKEIVKEANQRAARFRPSR